MVRGVKGRFTNEQVREIRASILPYEQLSKMFGVSVVMICKIKLWNGYARVWNDDEGRMNDDAIERIAKERKYDPQVQLLINHIKAAHRQLAFLQKVKSKKEELPMRHLVFLRRRYRSMPDGRVIKYYEDGQKEV